MDAVRGRCAGPPLYESRGEVFGAKNLAHLQELGIVAEDSAEHGAFSLEVVRQGWLHAASVSAPRAITGAVNLAQLFTVDSR
jgi:hypothetical protein